MYNKSFHIAFSELGKNKSIKEVKQRLCGELNVKSRVADSAINEAKTKLSAQRELLKTKKKDLIYELKKLKSELKKKKKRTIRILEIEIQTGAPSKSIVVENKTHRKRICLLKDKINRVTSSPA